MAPGLWYILLAVTIQLKQQRLFKRSSISRAALVIRDRCDNFNQSSRTWLMKAQLVKALLYLLPDSPFHHVLSGLAPPDPTNPTATAIFHVQSTVHNELPVLEEIVALIEAQETSFMEKEFESRRTRLNAGSLKEVRNEIGREIWAESQVRNTAFCLVLWLTGD